MSSKTVTMVKRRKYVTVDLEPDVALLLNRKARKDSATVSKTLNRMLKATFSGSPILL
jgi:hypothetical protein